MEMKSTSIAAAVVAAGMATIGYGRDAADDILNSMDDLTRMSPFITSTPDGRYQGFRLRIGKSYPFSSRRQQERNARQLAAGQIRFTA
jgi:hypothetical protein